MSSSSPAPRPASAGLLDRYLARTAYDAQQTDAEVEPGRPDNLWEPIPLGRAHGIFDAESRPQSVQFELSKRREWLLGGAALGLGLGAVRAVVR